MIHLPLVRRALAGAPLVRLSRRGFTALLGATLLAVAAGALPVAARAEDAPHIVVAGGALTEIVYALGAEKLLAGVDTSSLYPEAATKLPQVGYLRNLSPEGILSLKPTLFITTAEAGPPTVVEQVRSAGVKVVIVPHEHTVDATLARITEVGKAVGKEKEATALAAKVKTDMAAADAKVKAAQGKPKVLFIYARGGAVMNVAGANTAADAIIKLAGAENAITGFDNYKPLTSEAAVSAAPDVILITSMGLKSAGGIEDLLKQPGLDLTPAGKNRRVVSMDDLLLLGFTPRLPEAVTKLAEDLHAPAAAPIDPAAAATPAKP